MTVGKTARRTALLWLILSAGPLCAAPAPADSSAVAIQRPNPNPTGRVVLPRQGQSPDQQMADMRACYDEICDRLAWDPYRAYEDLVAAGYTVPLTARELERGLVCLGTEGAATGAVAGDLLGEDAAGIERGAEIGAAIAVASGLIRAGYLNQPDDPTAQRVVREFERQLRKWDRKFASCLSRRGYQVPSH